MKTILIILFVWTLSACNNGYEGVERNPKLKELESKLASALEAEDVMITAGYDSLGTRKAQVIRLIFVNSKKVSLSETEKEKQKWCEAVSNEFVGKFLEKTHKYDFIEVKFVEQIGFGWLAYAKRNFGIMYRIRTSDDNVDQNTEKMKSN